MGIRRLAAFTALVLLGLVAACGGGDDPTPTSAAPTATSPVPTATSPAVPGETRVPPTPTPTTPPIPAWQVEWEQALEAAKGEGVVIVGVSRAAYRQAAERFQETYPDIRVEGQVGRNPEERWIREQDSGIYSIDAALTSSTTVLRSAFPAGIIDVTRDFFVLPEVVDDENWVGLLDDHFCDNLTKKHIFCHWATPGETSTFLNTELVDEDTFTQADLFTPEFKGRWGIRDPRSAGAGQTWLTEKMITLGTDFIRRLMTETEPFLSQDDRSMAADIERGDILFCVGCSPIIQLHEEGVGLHVQPFIIPVKTLQQEFEGLRSTCCGVGTGKTDIVSFYTSATGGPSVLKNAPHPNALKVFLNWLEGSEGSREYLVTSGNATRQCSARVDLQDLCDRTDVMEDGKSYLSFDRQTTNHIEDLAAEIAEEIFGGR